jgi:hypothetical protein
MRADMHLMAARSCACGKYEAGATMRRRVDGSSCASMRPVVLLFEMKPPMDLEKGTSEVIQLWIEFSSSSRKGTIAKSQV